MGALNLFQAAIRHVHDSQAHARDQAAEKKDHGLTHKQEAAFGVGKIP